MCLKCAPFARTHAAWKSFTPLIGIRVECPSQDSTKPESIRCGCLYGKDVHEWPSYLIVNCVEVWAVWRSKIYGIKSGFFLHNSLTLSRERCRYSLLLKRV